MEKTIGGEANAGSMAQEGRRNDRHKRGGNPSSNWGLSAPTNFKKDNDHYVKLPSNPVARHSESLRVLWEIVVDCRHNKL